MPPLLEYNNVTIYRGDRVALNGISLAIHAGEHVAILGPNGCGKSTLIKTMTRELYPFQGRGPCSLRIMGEEIWNVFDLRAMLGIVTNDLIAACTRDFKGREIILSGFFSSVGIWPYHHVTPEMERKADEILRMLEIEHLADRYLDELSTGEARRIVIGRALVHDPKALVLDEPTNSLDLRATYELRDMIRKIAQAGTTIILVTHHLPDIIPEIGRVIFLQDGRVVQDGPKEEMLTSKSLSGLFGVPLELTEHNRYYQLW